MGRFAFFVLTMVAGAISAAPRISVEDFVNEARYGESLISPSGKHLAMRRPDDGRELLVIVDLESRKITHTVALAAGIEVSEFVWASPTRLAYGTIKRNGPLDHGVRTCDLFAINVDGTNSAQLWSTGKGGCPVVIEAQRGDDHVIVGTSHSPPQAHRLNVLTGQATLLATSPLPNGVLFTDGLGVPRAASGYDEKSGVRRLFYRAKGSETWTDASAALARDPDARIEGFAPDNQNLYLVAKQDSGTDALWLLDPQNQTRRLVQGHPSSDPVAFVRDELTIIGIDFEPTYPERVLVNRDSPASRLIASVELGFPDHMVQYCCSSKDRGRAIISTFSDRDPGEMYLLDTKSMKLTRLYTRMPKLDPALMPDREPIAFRSRDGMQISGYLTRPVGRRSKLPLVALPHGGPFGVRDGWAFDPTAALLAHNGYAVLQVNYRGSGGSGAALREAGYRQAGRAMEDDINDATQWAIKQGVADPKRVCIYGESYGAFAALNAAAREPGLYRCAVGSSGIYDLRKLRQVGATSRQRSAALYLEKVMGSDPADLAARSPVTKAKQISAAVFLAHGGRDSVAPPSQFEAMRTALTKAGRKPEELLLPDEGHGFTTTDNREAFYNRMLDFLQRNIGDGATGMP